MGSTPLRATPPRRLRGKRPRPRASRAPPSRPPEGTDPPGDLNATPDYKRHLARVLTRRALEQAAGVSS
jgi:carbon-monoxide dehydrogenase medium subunit